MSESEIVARACQGSDEAWTEVIQLHQEAVFRLAYLILGNALDAEYVAQETFIRALRRCRWPNFVHVFLRNTAEFTSVRDWPMPTLELTDEEIDALITFLDDNAR